MVIEQARTPERHVDQTHQPGAHATTLSREANDERHQPQRMRAGTGNTEGVLDFSTTDIYQTSAHGHRLAEATLPRQVHSPRGDRAEGALTGQPQPTADNPRESLRQAAERHIRDPQQRAQFHRDMDAFEARARNDRLDAGEVNRTFEQVNRLLNPPSDSTVPPERLSQLAREVMRQAARPESISQGNNNTCNVTTVENLIYSRQPSQAARLVADVATTGSYTAQDGTRVALDRRSLQPDREAQQSVTRDGERSFATQLFNVTAVNLHYQRNQPNIHYEMHPPSGRDPGGERLMDYSRQPPQRLRDCNGFINHPNLDDDHIIGIHDMISGSQSRDIYLGHRDSTDAGGSRVTTFASQAEFESRLRELQQNGRFPVILGVNTAIEPFYSEGGGGSPRGYDGAHVVVIRGIDAGPPMRVAVDNQYARGADHLGDRMLNARDLYLATMPTDRAIAHLQQEITDDHARGIRDPRKIAELRRLSQFTPARECPQR